MPVKPPSPCTYIGFPPCTELVVGGGRCAKHRAEAIRASAARRPGNKVRGYDATHRKRFRAAVLRRDPICRCDQRHFHFADRCPYASTDADHWPVSKRDLDAAGLDSNDPQYGRGLCRRCHSHATAITEGQRGGFVTAPRG